MGEARIRRGGTARLTRTTGPRGRNGPGRGRPTKRRSWIGRMLHALPISDEMLQRMASWAIVGLFVAIVVGIASLLGVPAMAGQKAAEIASSAGFEVQKVEVRGVERMDELPIYNIALGQVNRSMLALDLPKVRGEMLKLGWVKDARISRRLPDTLVVDIVERDPVAVWQHDGQLHLIDVAGVVLQPVSPGAMPDLPLVVGPNANRETANLNKLMENAPALKPMLAGATWVGDRRWDLRFQSGETLSLPEGDRASATALVNFARMDGINRLLGRGIVKFDMRDPDRFVLRLPENQGNAKPAAKADTSGASTDGEEG
ncbi:cell division protein FtsQ/DivIB [Sphingobium mellinum]|uniref:cell division protein FtsQ/DivIB n=1 Tax=Sphingobium mellinum TaxID=1387166 RepID=UPI0030ED1B0E